ncbi:MAG: hypothetical protein NZ902_01530 [Acidilobaceae archaeon]|nr:hypothetical protein [Acidilobaceae archaeon]MCX8165505.1 hypothetical protein [Acidilobaceae archaeon]MDW7973932.1 hypothetical protein [Sulfolobales archaeon]
MSRVLKRMSLISRLLVVISIGLLVSSVVAELYGAKLSTEFSRNVPANPQLASLLAIAALTSEGRVEVTVEGADNVYYLKVAGDPFLLAQQFRSLRLNVSNVRSNLDLRAGVSFTSIQVESNPFLVQALSLLGNVIPITEKRENVSRISERIRSDASLLIIAVRDTPGQIKYDIKYRIEEYDRLSAPQTLIASFLMIALAVAYEYYRRANNKTS